MLAGPPFFWLPPCSSFDTSGGELSRYAFADPSKKYTRNLIATDDRFSLMLLVWNPHKESPIHDHPCQGCWMRVISGSVVEHRYARDAEAHRLVPTSVTTASTGDTLYIDDSFGLHKVANPTDGLAMTLHLYSPPFTRCCIFLDPDHADDVLQPTTTYHSEFGEAVTYEEGVMLCGGDVTSMNTGCGAVAVAGGGGAGATVAVADTLPSPP